MLTNSIISCRICKNINLTNVIDLKEQIITSRFPVYGDFSTQKTPILLCICNNCGLVQLRDTVKSSELYEYEYGYRSGISNTMREHLKKYQEEILKKVTISQNDIIIDIGSNDSTMLQYYSADLRRIGIDPTGTQFKKYYNDVELISDYFTYENVTNLIGINVKCKIITSISMFYDLPDPVKFAMDIHKLLHDDGIWTCEQSYLLTMLEKNSIDTICHEHLEYYAVSQIKRIADLSKFKIIDITTNDCNGGSFRIYFAKKNSTKYTECTELIQLYLSKESEYGLTSLDTYYKFMKRCETEVKKLVDFIDIVNNNNKKIYVYGASTKGNCLLQYANLSEDKLNYAVERNLNKVGKMTSTGIPIISEETMRKSPPKYLLVLPYHFKNEIISREQEFLMGGGELVFPFPNFEIVGYKPKLLITGCDGMISQYVKNNNNSKKYNLYGIGHTDIKNYEPNIIKTYFDMNNTELLEKNLIIIKPDAIIHLASLSSSQQAYNNPILTLNTNGMLISHICDIIHKHGWETKLFNASSSEMYKGHINYNLENENDTHKFHLHPYSIAKIMGHSMVDFYRTNYKLPFSNGIIFTTESSLKSKNFLLNKVADHAKNWIKTKTILEVGDLSSYRNILHASDVAEAILKILEQERGDSYVICGDTTYQMIDLVIKIYKKNGIDVINVDGILRTVESKEIVLSMKSIKNNGLDNVSVNIRGITTKLHDIGWRQTIFIEELLDELCKNINSTNELEKYDPHPIKYISGGKFGDLIHNLSVINEIYYKTGRKGILYITDNILYGGDKFDMGIDFTYNDTFEVISSQKYIECYKIYENEYIDINLNAWRNNSNLYIDGFYISYKKTYGIDWGKHKWLTIFKKILYLQDKILINVSNDSNIDLNYIISNYGIQNLMFLSLNQSQYYKFLKKYKLNIVCLHVNNFYELSTVINSCKLYIGTQSGPLAVANAIHKDSTILSYKGDMSENLHLHFDKIFNNTNIL